MRNPEAGPNTYFDDHSAWEFIAARLEQGEYVRVTKLRKPNRGIGYVMKIDLGLGIHIPTLYVKLELGSSKIFGRSFHYSHPVSWST